MATMRAVAGPADALFINPETPKPSPSPAEALVRIRAFGLNRMDLMQREGVYPVPPQAPKTLGVEFSGTIESLGSDVAGDGSGHSFRVGDEVLGLAYGGAYAEYIVVATAMLMHKPQNLSFEEASGVPETWMTAYQALYLVGDYRKGDSVLWHAGASAVSICGIQLSKASGASEILVTASTKEKIEFCKGVGATDGFSYKEQDWAKACKEKMGAKGVDVIIDYIGADYFQKNLDSAAMDGRIVLLANLSGTKVPAGTDIAPIGNKRLRVEGSRLRSRDLQYQKKLRDKVAQDVLPNFANGNFKVCIEKIFSWKDIAQAHKLMEKNTSKGKIICIVD